MTEKELLEGIVRKDEAIFRHFVNQYKDLVFRVCFSVLQNKDDADDVAQEVFVKVFHSASTFRSDSKISTWLYRISLNMSLNFLNKRKRSQIIQLVENFIFKETEKNRPEVDNLEMEDYEEKKFKILYKSLNQLPTKQQSAFLLHHQEGLSYNEITEILGVSHSAVESLIHRAKTNLQKKITKELKRQNLFESYF